MKFLKYSIILAATALAVCCSSSADQGEPADEPYPEMTANRFTYKDVEYRITEAELTRSDASVDGNEVFILLLWAEDETGDHIFRFDAVVNSSGPGLTDGVYPFHLYDEDPDRVRWGSVVVYDMVKPGVDDQELRDGELTVYRASDKEVLVFTGRTRGDDRLELKYDGKL